MANIRNPQAHFALHEQIPLPNFFVTQSNLPPIDQTDLRILQLLCEDAQQPYTEVARRVAVSPGTVHVRMRKLAEQGIVRGATLSLDYTLLGFDVKAFLGIFLQKSALYDSVVDKLKAIPEVLSIDYTTGGYSIFAKLVCRDTEHLREVLHDRLQHIEGIERTETFISLDQSIDRLPRLAEPID